MSIANKLKVPDLCGAGSAFDSVLNDVDGLANEALNKIDGAIDTDASDIISDIQTKLTPLANSITGMLPELSDIPNVNMQAELKALNNLTEGSAQYVEKLATLKTQFGSAIDLDSLDLANVDICSLDNISLTSAGEVLTQSKDVILATAGETKDTLASLGNFTISVG
tara:strand:- start:130 stop:630 length:501 start_codon:yes stop_codon:yes gene_type:complete